MNIVRLRCRDAEEFASVYAADKNGAGVFCATTKKLEVGSDVVVELLCKLLPNRVLIAGRVIEWRPALPRLRVRAGATIRFAKAEAPKVAFVLETLLGQRPPGPRRRHARLPVSLPVTVRLNNSSRSRPAELREVSVNGGLIAGFPAPPIGSDLVLQIVPPGSETAMDITSRVLYHAGPESTGLKFLFREGGGSRRLRELVRRLRRA